MEIDWGSFTPMSALAGGALIGLAASLLLLANGRVAGISGIVGGLFRPSEGEVVWRVAFIAGLVLAPFLWTVLVPGGLPAYRYEPSTPGDWGAAGLGGFLVGFGTRFANGCTSGHGVCGLARLSRRSAVAVAVFVTFGLLTVFVVRHLMGA